MSFGVSPVGSAELIGAGGDLVLEFPCRFSSGDRFQLGHFIQPAGVDVERLIFVILGIAAGVPVFAGQVLPELGLAQPLITLQDADRVKLRAGLKDSPDSPQHGGAKHGVCQFVVVAQQISGQAADVCWGDAGVGFDPLQVLADGVV